MPHRGTSPRPVFNNCDRVTGDATAGLQLRPRSGGHPLLKTQFTTASPSAGLLWRLRPAGFPAVHPSDG
jgi:hypothetical protein